MSELQDMLRVQARLHRKKGANALGDLFQSAALEIEILTERLENPQGLQELICVEQMKEISLPEIHRANQKLHEQLAKANERVKELEGELNQSYDSFIKGVELGVFHAGSNSLNKFALEQKIEGIESSIAYAEGKSHFVDVSDLQYYIEQLRKEQSDER